MTDQFEALVTEVYDAAVDPLLWPIFLERLRRRLGAEFVSIVAIHKPTIRVAHVHHTPWDATAISDLADRQLVRVPMRDKILFGMLDTPVSTLQLMSEEEFQRSSFHRDWVAPNRLRDGSTTLIADMAEELISIGFVTSQQRDPVTADEMMLVQRLSPHLRRAFMIGETLERTRWGAEIALGALSGIATPILICDATGHLIFANPAAENALNAEGPLLVRHGRVEPRALAVRTSFSEALQRATRGILRSGGAASPYRCWRTWGQPMPISFPYSASEPAASAISRLSRSFCQPARVERCPKTQFS